MRVFCWMWAAAGIALAGTAWGWGGPLAPPTDPGLFLADETRVPVASISWPTRSGEAITLQAERSYASPNERTYLGRNLDCFVALGGTRLDRGAGHPHGAIVRIGIYKTDNRKPLFDDIADDAVLTVQLRNVHFNQPPTPRPQTAVQHVRFMPEDLDACGLGGSATDLYNTASPTDTLKGRITLDNGRLGVLDGDGPERGSVVLAAEPDGSVSMTAHLPYALLRHVKDPWLRTIPGAFAEPNHFHVEFEVLPAVVAREIDEAIARGEEPPSFTDDRPVIITDEPDPN